MKKTLQRLERRLYLLGKYGPYLTRKFMELNKEEFHNFVDNLDFTPPPDGLDSKSSILPKRIG